MYALQGCRVRMVIEDERLNSPTCEKIRAGRRNDWLGIDFTPISWG